MNEHLTQAQIEELRAARRLSPPELFAVGQHLGECAECRARVDVVRANAERLRDDFRQAARLPEHLSFEQLSALVDDSLNEIDREIAESHLSVCPLCEREMRDLRAFAVTLESEKRKVAAADAAGERGFWEKVRAFIFSPAFGASFAALLIFAVVAGVWFSRRQQQPETGEIVKTEYTPTPTASLNSNQNSVQTANAAPSPENKEQIAQTTPAATEPKTAEQKRVIETPALKTEIVKPKRAEEFSAADAEIVRRALENGEIRTPDELNDLFARTGNFMGGQNSPVKTFQIETPARAIVNETQPIFRWRKVAEADEYRVGIYDENFNKVAEIQNLQTTQWRVAKPLRRGGVYVWEVEALKDGKIIGTAPAPTEAEARFKILEANKSKQMRRELQKNPASALWKGIVYARFGLLAEAVHELERYAAENPNSGQARRLLDKIKSLQKN